MLQVRFISFLLFFSFFCQVWTYESLNEFPLILNTGGFIIHATLTDLNSNKKYAIDEYIYTSVNDVQGKISISSDFSSPMNVHHSSRSANERLVVRDYDCDLFTHKTRWDKMLKGITQPLLNDILLMGPSLVYRLQHKSLVWKSGNNAEIRGTTMHSVYTTIGGNRLNITYYYKSTYNSETGISHPSRIQFTGNDPSGGDSTGKQNLILDIYLQNTSDETFEHIVTPKPGIGCPVYFTRESDATKIFNIALDSVFFISIENIDGVTKKSSRNEVYADEANKLLWTKKIIDGITSETILDYQLGLIYMRHDKGSCLISPMTKDTPGVKIGVQPFSISGLLDSALDYRYLGKLWFENRPELGAEGYELVTYNGATSSGKYDKVVRTIYIAETATGKFSVTPLGETINAYNKTSTGSYALKEKTTRDYYDFTPELSDETYESIDFKISDCYPETSDWKTLAIYFDCQNKNCNHAIKEHYYTFRDQVKTSIVIAEVIAGSRIGKIDIVTESTKIIAYVTFFTLPALEHAFESETVQLSKSFLINVKSISRSIASSAEDCLKQNANMETNFEAIIYGVLDKSCVRISKMENLIQDKQNGVECIVWYIPLKNLNRYNAEVPLDKVQNKLEGRDISFTLFDDNQLVHYVLSSVEEVHHHDKENRQLYAVEGFTEKFVQDGSEIVKETGVASLAGCYHACANLGDKECEYFSYCHGTGGTECFLSKSLYEDKPDKRVHDARCQIYRKNNSRDYMKVKNRAYSKSTSVATNHGADDCANLCTKSNECFSYQTCGDKCILGGYYTDAHTLYSADCNIYIPNLAHKFTLTGKKIVTETYYTENGLTLDQCAALCYDFGQNDYDCKSYNYCPEGQKTASSCSMSIHSVKDSSTKTSESNTCLNYELIGSKAKDGGKSAQNTNSQSSLVKGTSGGAAFGIILLFISIGLVIGAIGPFLYNRSRLLFTNLPPIGHDTSHWTRQLNEDDQPEQYSI